MCGAIARKYVAGGQWDRERKRNIVEGCGRVARMVIDGGVAEDSGVLEQWKYEVKR